MRGPNARWLDREIAAVTGRPIFRESVVGFDPGGHHSNHVHYGAPAADFGKATAQMTEAFEKLGRQMGQVFRANTHMIGRK